MGRDDFAEVVKNEPGKDFLLDILHLFCMKATQSDCILEFAERRFNSPTHCVELFEFVRREFVARQIGDHAFIGVGRERKTYNAECHRIELVLIQKIKRAVVREKFIDP